MLDMHSCVNIMDKSNTSLTADDKGNATYTTTATVEREKTVSIPKGLKMLPKYVYPNMNRQQRRHFKGVE
jgi:hypothetical protein